jgi:D-proline reductase (dithiol) PrdB
MTVDSFKFMPRTLAESLKVWPYTDMSAEEIPWTPLGRPLQECTVALVSSGGLYQECDRPFDLDRERREPLWGDPSFREIPRDISQGDLRAAHLHYRNDHVLDDVGCMMPLAALEQVLAEGRIGAISEKHLTIMGYQPKVGTLLRETAPLMADRLREMDVDVVLLSSG